VKWHRVTVEIHDQVATTHIDQVFYNPNPVQLEGIYMFPLPEGAAMSDFSMFIDGKEFHGEVLGKEKARKIYEDIVRRMKDPALLEYAGEGMFKARVYPIPARGEKRIKFSYNEILRKEARLIRYRYPLNTEKFSSRPLDECVITATIKSSAPIRNVYSTSHKVSVDFRGEVEARVGFEQRNVKPDKDFVLYFSRSKEAIDMSLLTYRPSGEDGYFLLLLSPRRDLTEEEIQQKDICFVIDTSQSMSESEGRKLKKAKAAVSYCLQNLNEGDRFNVIDFATEVRCFRERLVPATAEYLEAAQAYVKALRPLGATNFYDALTRAFSMAGTGERPFMVCFLTDGRPTIGITRTEQLVKKVQDANKKKGRLFVFGVGADELNIKLLDRLAESNRGTREYILPEEDLELKLSSFYDKISHPVLSNLVVEFPGLGARDVYPKEVPDLFRGSQMRIVGRFKAGGTRAIRLRGDLKGKVKELTFEGNFDAHRDSRLPRLWAKIKIGYLIDQMRLHGESKEVRDEVIRLAKRYGIVTPFTSSLVLEEERKLTGRPGIPRPARRPGEPGRPWAPQFGRIVEKLRGGRKKAEAEADEAKRAFDGVSGKGTVGLSRRLKKLKEGYLDGEERDQTAEILEIKRELEDRTFYKRDGVWVDSLYRAGTKTEKVPYLGDAYFKLLGKGSLVRKILALGPRVIFRCEGRFYEITGKTE
jgi:Ca-activated chloride channel family protein